MFLSAVLLFFIVNPLFGAKPSNISYNKNDDLENILPVDVFDIQYFNMHRESSSETSVWDRKNIQSKSGNLPEVGISQNASLDVSTTASIFQNLMNVNNREFHNEGLNHYKLTYNSPRHNSENQGFERKVAHIMKDLRKTTLISGSGNITTNYIAHRPKYKSLILTCVHLEQYEQPYVNGPSPCLNGGLFVKCNGKYVCNCTKRFTGSTCNIDLTVCYQPFGLKRQLPCIALNKTCRPVAGGGFVCESNTITSRYKSFSNMSSIVDCNDKHRCPSGWKCMNVNLLKENYRCEPPHNQLLNAEFYNAHEKARYKRSIIENMCDKNLCQHGSRCKRNKCICLMHYMGRYCEQEVNYCLSNPCKIGVPCVPRLGGYKCKCPSTHFGLQCEIPKRVSLQQMRSPNFIYVIQQYTGIEYDYCFFAKSVGDLPTVTINFGDGYQTFANEMNFTHISKPQNKHLRKQFPNLNFYDTDLLVVAFKHIFKKPGLFNLTVKATSMKHLVYMSKYPVQVDLPSSCTMKVKLRNCVKSVGANITEYTREDHIVILSDIEVNCSHSRLNFVWSLYKTQSKFDKPTEQNWFHIESEVATHQPYLNIYPYTLPFGIYIAQLNVTLRKPESNLFDQTHTWFQIKEMKMVARLFEGTIQQTRWSDPLVINASLSYNPNMPPDKQDNLNFMWTCRADKPMSLQYAGEKDTFCPMAQDIPLAATGPILRVPPRSLLLHWSYTFYLAVSVATVFSDINNLTEATTHVIIEVKPDNTPIMTIKCVRNCENNKINIGDTTVFEAVCLTCTNDVSKDLSLIEWSLVSLDSLQAGTPTVLDNIFGNNEFDLQSSTLILNEGTFVGHRNFILSLISIADEFNDTNPNSGYQELKGEAQRNIHVSSPPETGYCTIVPQFGFAVITDFHIFCYNFKDKYTPLMYEATQFKNYSSNSEVFAGTLVGYEMESEIHDLKLEAGFPDYDFVTLVRVIVSSRYMYTFYDLNATVFPVLYLDQTPSQVLSYLTNHIADENSMFGKIRDTKNIFAKVQIIKVIAESTTDLLESYYSRYLDIAGLAKTVEYIRNNLVYYLSQQEMLNLEGLKHFATALNAIVKLPRYHGLSAATKVGTQMFIKIIDMLTHLKSKHSKMNKADVEDLAPQIMSIASNLLKMPHDLRTRKFQFRTLGFTMKDDDQRKTKNEEVFVKSYKEFANLTNTILQGVFSYGFHIIPFKANKEESTLCQSETPNMKLSVQKNSPLTFHESGLFIQGHVGTVPFFSTDRYDSKQSLSVFLLYMQDSPFWWHPQAREISYPVVQLQMYDNINSKPLKVPTKVMIHSTEHLKHKTIHGQLEIHPYWTLNDYDIQVNRIQVPKRGKVILQFMPTKGDYKIQVVVKKGFRPEVVDFWNEATTVPQKVIKNGTLASESYTVYVDEESTSDKDFYYVGVLPHVDTIHTLLDGDTPDSLFRKFEHSAEHEENDNEEEIVIKDEEDLEAELYHPRAMKIHEAINNTLPFEYAAYGVRCLSLNITSDDWTGRCQVRPATTTETIFCKCTDLDILTVSFQNVQEVVNLIRSIHFYFAANDNPLTFYLIFFILILFALLWLWALWLDNEEIQQKDVIFLADNDPRHSYVYLVIVQTGRRPHAGTTSNVTIQLIGDKTNSEVHVLKSAHHPVLARGQQDWFVLKTEANLGNICWINMWHDHLESDPHWYCSKVIVQDVQTNELWFFFAEQWFAPLYGDGSMSYSIYNTQPEQVFKKRYQFRDTFANGFGEGLHGWFGPFYKNQYSNYTRCQRVITNFVHILIMLTIIVHLFDYQSQDDSSISKGSPSIAENITNGIWTAMIAFPFHFCLALAFTCVAPRPPWWNTPRYLRQFMTIDKPHKNQNMDDKYTQKTFDLLGDEYYPVAYTVDMSIPPEKYTRRQPQPIVAQGAGPEEFLLPSWFRYVLWFIVSAFILVSLFFIYLNGVDGFGTSYNDMLTVLTTLIFSMFVLELSKVVIYAIYHSLRSSEQITLEDRSKLVMYLNDEYVVAPALIPKRLAELSKLRKRHMYKPIPEERVNVLQRNAIRETSVRSMIADIGIILLFMFLLIIAIHGITDSLGFYNVKNVQHLIQGDKGYGKIPLNKVVEQEGFLNYINQSLIPNLYAKANYNGSPLKENVQAKDLINYLIGVPRLRQTRIHRSTCKRIFKPNRQWAHRCRQGYWIDEDTEDYGPSWTKLKQKPTPNGTASGTNPWIHQSWWETRTPGVSGVVSTYSGGGYTALLGRSQEASWKILSELMANKWFDNHTVAVFFEFSLYNPNRNLVSLARILAENTILGGYSIQSTVELVKVKPIENVMPYIIFALFTILIVTIIICAYHDGFKIKQFRRWTYFGNIWFAINIFLAVVGTMVAFCLLKRTLLLSSSLDKLSNPNVHEYVDFNVLMFWDNILIVMLGMMMFLVIMQTWHLLSVEYRFHLMTTVLQVANHSLLCYFVILIIFLCAFTTTGHLLFTNMSYQFRHVVAAFTAMVGYSHRSFDYNSITHTPHISSFLEENWGKCFFLTFFLMFFFIFRWGFVVILIEKFCRLRLVVLQRKWLESVVVSFMQMNLASVRDFGRRGFSRTEADSLVDEYIKASFQRSMGRLSAMEQIVSEMEAEKKLHGTYSGEFITKAKQLAMVALVIDHINGQMQYKSRRRQQSDNQVGSAIKSSYTKEREVAVILASYLKVNALEQKLSQLNETLDELIKTDLL